MVLDAERRNTPPGYRQEPHNRIQRHRAEAEQQQESERPDYEEYKKPAASQEKLHEKLVGNPVGSEDTISSVKDDAIRDGNLGPNTVETVTEARLGGGEETLYSPEDGPPLHHSAPMPRS